MGRGCHAPVLPPLGATSPRTDPVGGDERRTRPADRVGVEPPVRSGEGDGRGDLPLPYAERLPFAVDRTFEPLAQALVRLAHGLRVDLEHAPVMRHEPVGLLLDVDELGVDESSEPLVDRRPDLVVLEPQEGPRERVAVGVLAVAELLLAPGVAGDAVGVAAVLAEDHGARVVRVRARELVRAEVDVAAHQVAAALVVPSAGVVDDAGGVERPHVLGDLVGVELPPPLVERHPHRDAGHRAQQVDRLLEFVELARPSSSWRPKSR